MRAEPAGLEAAAMAAARTKEHWFCLLVMGWLALACWARWRRTQRHDNMRRRDQMLHRELEAYARLDATLPPGGDARAMAQRVCRLVSENSALRRAALLLRDADGRLYVAGSAGMGDQAVAALALWGAHSVEQERGAVAASRRSNVMPQDMFTGTRVGMKSFLLELMPHEELKELPGGPVTLRDLRGQAILLPLVTSAGHAAGALAVSAEDEVPVWAPTLAEAVAPLEALAAKLGRSLENAALTERLMRAEKLAGLGQLAGGVAHELNNPLTVVLGFAELIVQTAAEARVRDDARTVMTEALRMREIVQSLVDFWRPVAHLNHPVEMVALVRDVAASCAARLEQRGVKLVVAAPEGTLPIRGDAERLRVVLQHLLNNAAQAIEEFQAGEQLQSDAFEQKNGLLEKVGQEKGDAEPPTIRVTVSESGGGMGHSGGRVVHVVVGDTGPGFREPARVFDPFYTTRPPGEGPGLGLSICYGIVREHGGDISALNLHPRGAAVVMELPVGETVAGESAAALLLREIA